MIAARLIEALVFTLTVGAGLFALYLLVDLLRLRRAARGPVYRGGIGQWSWAAHRITGVGVIAFLFGHIVDTFAIGFGPELYDETIALYKQWWFAPFEVGLVGAVLYHALNGIRVMLVDFWEKGARYQKQMLWVVLGIWVLVMIPGTYYMLVRTVTDLLGGGH